MKKAFIIIISIIAGLGVLLTGAGLIVTKGDLSSIFKSETRTEAHIDETLPIDSLEIRLSSDNVEFLISEDEFLHIEYWNSDIYPITYSVENGKAKLIQDSTFRFVFSWNVRTYTDKIYIPESLINSVYVNLASGSFTSEISLDIATLNIRISSGEINLKNIEADEVNIDISSGDTCLEDVNFASADIDSSSGSVNIKNGTIPSLDLNFSSGDITLTGCTVGNFVAKLSSGSVNTTDLVLDAADIDVSSGSITLRVAAPAADYSVDIDVSSGSVQLSGTGVNVHTDSDVGWGSGSKLIKCDSSSGDVKIYFQ